MQFVKQFIKFGLIGVLNTVISLVIYYLFIWINTGWYIWGNIVGFVAGTFNAYIWNSRLVFQNERLENRKINVSLAKMYVLKTYISYGGSLILNTGLLLFCVDVAGVSKVVAPLIGLAISVPLNFLANKFWVYK